jgi:hypothetical protein
MLHVQPHGPLSACKKVACRVEAGAGSGRTIYANYFRAKIGQDHPGVGDRREPGHFDDANTLERAHFTFLEGAAESDANRRRRYRAGATQSTPKGLTSKGNDFRSFPR